MMTDITLIHRYADHVSVSDDVLVIRNGQLTPAKVINVTLLKMQGDHYSYKNTGLPVTWKPLRQI